jgi:hypothetical protein
MNPRRAALLVFVLALGLRVAALCALDGGASRPLEGDEKGYAAVAGSLVRGEGFQLRVAAESIVDKNGNPLLVTMKAFRAPLLPLVVAPVHWISGGSPAALRLWCALLGALAAPLAFVVAARIGGVRAGWIAGLAVALWPAHVWLSARVLSEPLDSVLLLAAADLLLRQRFATGGATLGLAVLCRPGGILAAGLAGLAAGRVEEKGRRLGAMGLVLATAAVVVAPWVVRNWVVLGRPMLVSSGGVTLLGGNCPAALEQEHPGKWVPPEAAWERAVTATFIAPFGPYFMWDSPDLGMYGWSDGDEPTSDERFAEKAESFVRNRPGDAALLACWKVVRFLDPDTHSGKGDAGLKALLGWLSWGLVLPLVVLAFVLGANVRRPEWWMAGALLLGHLLAAVIAYGDARMRAPIEPALLALLVGPLLAGLHAKWTARGAPATVTA